MNRAVHVGADGAVDDVSRGDIDVVVAASVQVHVGRRVPDQGQGLHAVQVKHAENEVN